MNPLDQVIAHVLPGPLDDYRRGRIPLESKDEVSLMEHVRRRMPQIRAQLAEMTAPAKAHLCSCGAAATTRINGGDYCDVHAASAPRLPPPIRRAGT